MTCTVTVTVTVWCQGAPVSERKPSVQPILRQICWTNTLLMYLWINLSNAENVKRLTASGVEGHMS